MQASFLPNFVLIGYKNPELFAIPYFLLHLETLHLHEMTYQNIHFARLFTRGHTAVEVAGLLCCTAKTARRHLRVLQQKEPKVGQDKNQNARKF